jgi:hypothetical protein
MSHIKLKDLLNEVDWRINTKSISGGGGKRFIPTEGKVPSRVFTSLPDYFKLRGSRVFVSPEAIIAMNSIQRGRGGATNYKELTGKIQQAFSIPRTGANLNIGPADTSSDLSVFKKGLTGRLDSAVVGGKEFKVWNGMGKGDEKGNFTFPLDQFKTMEENVEEYGIYEDSSNKFETLVGSMAQYLNSVSRDEMFDESGNYNSTLKRYHDELKQYSKTGTEEEQLKANFLLGFI